MSFTRHLRTQTPNICWLSLTLKSDSPFLFSQARYLNSVTEIPHFEIEPEYALETLMAADFLDSKSCCG